MCTQLVVGLQICLLALQTFAPLQLTGPDGEIWRYIRDACHLWPVSQAKFARRLCQGSVGHAGVMQNPSYKYLHDQRTTAEDHAGPQCHGSALTSASYQAQQSATVRLSGANASLHWA